MVRWNDRIRRAEKRGGFTVEDVKRAEGYMTCKAGEWLRDLGIAPPPQRYFTRDSEAEYLLRVLGLYGVSHRFYWAVKRGDVEAAKTIAVEIDGFRPMRRR